LHDASEVNVEKEVSNPSNDVIDNDLHDFNEVPKDLKQTFQKFFTPPLSFTQSIAKGKLDL